MVVALRAHHAGAKEDLGGHRHVVERHVVIANVEADRAILVRLAIGRDHLTHHLVVGLVGLQRLAHVIGA